MKKFKKGDKVKIIQCPLHPQFTQSCGKIEKVLLMYGIPYYKVSCNGKMIPDWATEDCLEQIE